MMHYSTYTRYARPAVSFSYSRNVTLPPSSRASSSPILSRLLPLVSRSTALANHAATHTTVHTTSSSDRARRRARKLPVTTAFAAHCAAVAAAAPFAQTSFGNTSAATTYGTGPNEQLKLRR